MWLLVLEEASPQGLKLAVVFDLVEGRIWNWVAKEVIDQTWAGILGLPVWNMTGLICLAYVAGWTAGSFGIFPFPPPLTLRLSPKQRLVTTQTGTFKAETCLGVLVFSQGKVPVLYSGLGICEAGARRSLSFLIPLPLTLLASVFLRAMVGRAWEMEWEGVGNGVPWAVWQGAVQVPCPWLESPSLFSQAPPLPGEPFCRLSLLS